MKRELKEYAKKHYKKYEILEKGKQVLTMYDNEDWAVRTFDDRGNKLTSQWRDGTKFRWTWDENDEMLTYIVNGELTYDNRAKEITITLTQTQLDKIKKAGLLYVEEVKL